jgi:hypothetical protein
MGLLIILIIGGVIWYKYQEKEDKENQEEKSNKGQETFEEFKNSTKEAKAKDNFYINEVPYGVRRKTAMDTFLHSDRSNIKVDFSDKQSMTNRKDNNVETDREITDDDLLVNAGTGEITTPEMTFNKSKSNKDDSLDTEKVIPVVENKSNLKNVKHPNSASNKRASKQPKEEGTIHYREDWKSKNYKSFDDLLNGSSEDIK